MIYYNIYNYRNNLIIFLTYLPIHQKLRTKHLPIFLSTYLLTKSLEQKIYLNNNIAQKNKTTFCDFVK